MLSDTEAPSAPPRWAESIHGDLVLVDRARADRWQHLEREAIDPGERVVVPGVLTTISRGAGLSLKLVTPEEMAATAVVVRDDGSVLLVTHLGGPGEEALLEAAAQVPDEAYVATDVTFTAGFVGAVLFDATASWEMAGESLLYVFAQFATGDHRVDVTTEQSEGDLRYRVIRLRRVA